MSNQLGSLFAPWEGGAVPRKKEKFCGSLLQLSTGLDTVQGRAFLVLFNFTSSAHQLKNYMNDIVTNFVSETYPI